MDERVKWGLIALMIAAWVVSMLAPIFVSSYKPPPEIHVAFMSVIGILAAQKTSGGDS